jgi:hypothetical protein
LEWEHLRESEREIEGDRERGLRERGERVRSRKGLYIGR